MAGFISQQKRSQPGLSLQTDILSIEAQHPVFPLQPGGGLPVVAGADAVHRQVGGDDGGLSAGEAGIDQRVEGGLDEGGGKFAAQIVQNQQVTAQIAAGLLLGLPSFLDVP